MKLTYIMKKHKELVEGMYSIYRGLNAAHFRMFLKRSIQRTGKFIKTE